jgi:hypothetical protein
MWCCALVVGWGLFSYLAFGSYEGFLASGFGEDRVGGLLIGDDAMTGED